MSFLKNIFSKKNKVSQPDITTIEEFWQWFSTHGEHFYQLLKTQDNVEAGFIKPVRAQLSKVNEGAYFLMGMKDDDTAEFALTADGQVRLFPAIEEFVEKGPTIDHWVFTAFKPPMNPEDMGLRMGEKTFTHENIFFYAVTDDEHPDNIIIKLVYKDDFVGAEAEMIERGCALFVENYIGEVKATTHIDQLVFDEDVSDEQALNPIGKLADYITWREKEFVEKYEGTVYNTEESNYSTFEWESDEQPFVGMCNADLLKWDRKASHPWVCVITIAFDGSQHEGMPAPELLEDIHQFEEDLRGVLKDSDGYIHVAQKTGAGERNIYYANKEYTRPIAIIEDFREQVGFEYDFEIFRDKYWQSMKLFEQGE